MGFKNFVSANSRKERKLGKKLRFYDFSVKTKNKVPILKGGYNLELSTKDEDLYAFDFH